MDMDHANDYYNYLLQYDHWRKSIILCILYLRKRKRQHRLWVRDIFKQRSENGHFHCLIWEIRSVVDPQLHFNYMRMSAEHFDLLLSKVRPLIERQTTTFREPISASERLACTLRYLASGDSMVSQSYNFCLGKATVTNLVKSTCQAIWEGLYRDVLLCDPTQEKWLEISSGFMEIWDVPHCIGAIDGKHIVIQAPPNCDSTFSNYKKSHSLILLAICDANYQFTIVDIGAQGRQSDGGVFKKSGISTAIQNESLHIPPPCSLEMNGPEVPYFFVGDEAFTPTTYMMRPFPGHFLNQYQRIFNYRLSRVRRTIENSFGILTSRFRIFRKPIIASVDTVESITKATICLHNWLMRTNRNLYCSSETVDRDDECGNITEGTWRTEVSCLEKIRCGSNTSQKEAKEIQETLAHFFLNRGSIPFQWTKSGEKPP